MTLVEVPYQSHIRYNECQSTSAVPAIDYCEVQMCLSMNYVLILQHYLRLLAPCCNPTYHLKHMSYRDEYTLQVLKSSRMSVTSTMEMPWSKKYPWKTGQTNESMCEKYTEHFKKEIWPTKVLSVWWLTRWSFYKDNSHLRWKKSSGSNSSYSKEAPQVHYLKNDFLSVKVNQLGYIFVQWWNGDTYWDWLKASWRVFNGGSPLQLQD